MSITLTGYRIKVKAAHVVKAGIARPGEYKTISIKGTEADMIAAIRADEYKGKICPQYSGTA